MSSKPNGPWGIIDEKVKHVRVPRPYRKELDERGSRAAVRFYGCLKIWPWDLLPELYEPEEWGVGLLQSLALLALDYSQAKNLTVDGLRDQLIESIIERSGHGEQRLRYADVQAVRAEVPINADELPEYNDDDWDNLADNSASRRKRIKTESPGNSFKAPKAMNTPPPTPGRSAEAKRRKIVETSHSAEPNTAPLARESPSQRPSSSDPASLPSVALVYSHLLIKAAEPNKSTPVPSSIHESLRPALAEFDARLDSLMKDASQAHKAANAKLKVKLAEYQELKLQKLTSSNDTVNRAKKALRDANGRHKALTAEAEELEATATSLSGSKILGHHGKAPRLPQLRHAIDAYTRLSQARRWEAKGEGRTIADLEQRVVEAERLAKRSTDVFDKLKQEVSDASKDSEDTKAGLEVLKNVKTMVLGVERTIPDLEKMAMS